MLKNEFNFLDDLFTFGKYEGLTLSTVLDINPDYVKWCVLNVDTPLFLLFDTAIYQIRKAYPEFIIDKDFNFARICKLRKYNVLEYKEKNVVEKIPMIFCMTVIMIHTNVIQALMRKTKLVIAMTILIPYSTVMPMHIGI